MRIKLFIGLFFLFQYVGFSQGEWNNWYFGQHAGITFNSGNPIPLNNCASLFKAYYSTTTVSDSLGNLLFYADRYTYTDIFNKNHVVMPNGIIPGSNWPQTPQPHFVVQKLNDDSTYFFFTVDDPFPANNPGLRYSIIDMRLDGGLGDVVVSQKNIPVPGGNNASSVLSGTRHKNNHDAWIITREYNSYNYLSYLITPSGLNLTPVISTSLIPPDPNYSISSLNQIKVSPDGSKMVFLCSDTVEYCSFNSSTGQITPLFHFICGNIGGWLWRETAEFSIDSKYLYIHAGLTGNDGALYQYDATKTDSIGFKQSEILLFSELKEKGLQRGPDGKIYCTEPNKDSLSVINNPTLQGLACNYQKNAICLLNGNLSYFGLPQFLQRYYLYLNHSGQCVGDSISFSSLAWPSLDSLSWNFGDPASGGSNVSHLIHPKHNFTNSGNFVVTLIARHEDQRFDTVIQSISIKPSPIPLLGVDQTICTGDSVTFDAGFCSGCTYQWSNLTTTQPNIGTGQTYKTGEAAIYMVSVKSSNGCIGRDTVQLFTSPVPLVINNPLSKSICSGESTNISLTSNVSGTMFHWTTTLTSGNITGFSSDSGIVINQVLINSLSTSGIVTYHITPKVGSCTGTTVDFPVTVNAGDSVKVSISASNNNICTGTSVTFTATPTNGGSTPTYQWLINGIGGNPPGSTFTFTPANGDVTTCILTSSNTICTSNNPATSNAISMVVNPNLPVSVTISASDNPVCAGTSVTFTATPTNGGSSPSYMWKVNGGGVFPDVPTMTYVSTNGDIVSCVLTSSNTVCVSNNPATSNAISMVVNPLNSVSVLINTPDNPFCQGSSVSFTATPTNGGTTPSYSWKVNGVGVGSNNPIYSYVPANGDLETCVMNSNIACPTVNPATSNTITMVENTVNPVSIVISTPATNVCSGTSVIYTANPTNGGTTPNYQWKVNGVNNGANNFQFTYTPVNGDCISCILTSNLVCASGNPATSNSICMTVNPNLPVSVGIAANPPGAVCAGTTVMFTATGTHPGNNPVYTWKVNGVNVGGNSTTYSYVPASGDQVLCILNSDATCATGNPATSNLITEVVNPNLPVSVVISASNNPVCSGIPVTYTATPTNGGTTPVYLWKINGINAGTNSTTYQYVPVNGDLITCTLTSNLTCTSGNPATSNTITMGVAASPVVTLTRCNDSITTTTAQPFRLKGGIPLGGNYSGPGVSNGIFYPAISGVGSKTITYSFTNAALCSATANLTIIVNNPAAFACGNNLTDIRDNKVYTTVQIGSQCWMAANLNYGLMIPGAISQRDDCTPEKYCFNDLTADCGLQTYYQWDELMAYDETLSTQGLCPPGWHVPTEADWHLLFGSFVSNAFAAWPLLFTGYSGFNATLSATRHQNRTWDWNGFATFFWSSTSYGPYKAWAHGMNDYDPSVSFYPSSRANAFSIRCLKD